MDSEPKEIKILCIDGGGIRGIIPTMFLHDLEKRLDKPIYNYFDLVCGTSTGAIIALAISFGVPMNRVVSLYEKKGDLIFPKGKFKTLINLLRYCSQYNGKELKKELKELFGDKKLADLNSNILIPSSNITSNSTKPLNLHILLFIQKQKLLNLIKNFMLLM